MRGGEQKPKFDLPPKPLRELLNEHSTATLTLDHRVTPSTLPQIHFALPTTFCQSCRGVFYRCVLVVTYIGWPSRADRPITNRPPVPAFCHPHIFSFFGNFVGKAPQSTNGTHVM